MKTKKTITAIVVAIVTLLLNTSSAVGEIDKSPTAQPLQPIVVPQTEPSCDPEEMGEDIQTSAGNLADTICETSDIVARDNTGFFSAKDQDFYAKQCNRAKGWINAPGRETTFASQGKANKDSCYIVEIENDVDDKLVAALKEAWK